MRPWVVAVKYSLGKREVRVEKFLVLAANEAAAEAAVDAPGAEAVEVESAEGDVFRIAIYKEVRKEDR